MTSELQKTVDDAEKIGVIGSPSTTSQLTLDVLATAVEKHLVGSMSVLRFNQDGHANYALGQITEVVLRNQFAQDPTMRGLIRQRGSVDPITGQQDTHTADMLVSAVFKENESALMPSSFGTVPSTGTSIRLINQKIVDGLVKSYSDDVVYVGKIFGTDVLLPSWFRHFGKSAGGIGDAMHLGIFGKTGSGKSFLGKMILTAYMRHKTMSLLVLDPQGEFAKMKDDKILMEYVEKKLGRKIEVYDLPHLILVANWDLFKRILIASGFIKNLGIRADENQMDAADQIVRILRHNHGNAIASSITGPVDLWTAYRREVFNHVWERLTYSRPGTRGGQSFPVLDQIYTPGSAAQNRVINTMQNANVEEFYQQWVGVANLFGRENQTNTFLLTNILESIGDRHNGRIVIINLSSANVPEGLFWNEDAQIMAINQTLERLVRIAQEKYNEGGDLNALVVVDEAHRLAPRERTDNEDVKILRTTLRDAIRTTRKFKLGWMFISQTLASLDREIIQQLRMYFFGFGLAWGTELDALRELIGGNKSAEHLYQQFKDPESSIMDKQYSFMSVGPSSPMSFSAVPLFFNSLQYPEEFISVNPKKPR